MFLIVLWLQYALLALPLAPTAKGTLMLAFGFILAWIADSTNRRAPPVARVV
jgi:hypothetical protein